MIKYTKRGDYMMTLDELSALVKRIQTYPIAEVEVEINRLAELIKYTRHQRRLRKYIVQINTLKEFKLIHEMMTKKY